MANWQLILFGYASVTLVFLFVLPSKYFLQAPSLPSVTFSLTQAILFLGLSSAKTFLPNVYIK
jgi:hypothetical protein